MDATKAKAILTAIIIIALSAIWGYFGYALFVSNKELTHELWVAGCFTMIVIFLLRPFYAIIAAAEKYGLAENVPPDELKRLSVNKNGSTVLVWMAILVLWLVIGWVAIICTLIAVPLYLIICGMLPGAPAVKSQNEVVVTQKLSGDEEQRADKADELAALLRQAGIADELMRILKNVAEAAEGKEDAELVIGLRYKGEEDEDEDEGPKTDWLKTAGLIALGGVLFGGRGDK